MSKQPQKILYRKKMYACTLRLLFVYNVHLILPNICLIVTEDKDFMERFCKDIKEHATKIINYEEKRNDTTN